MKRGEIFPSWRYHPDGRSTLCETAEQDALLGDEWSDDDVRSHAGPAVTIYKALEGVSAPSATVADETADDLEPPKRRGRKPKA